MSLHMFLSAHVGFKLFGVNLGVPFSGSKGYKLVVNKVIKNKLIMSTASCKYYFAKLNYLDLPELSSEVMEWIGRMNHSLKTRGFIDDALVYDFVDYFGTHIPSEMVYGARITYGNLIMSSLTTGNISGNSEISTLFGFGYKLTASQKAAIEEFQKHSVTSTTSIGAPPPISGDAEAWASTVKDTPLPVKFELIPIYELFDNRKLSLAQDFGLETSHKIRNKIRGIATKYCSMLYAQGHNVKCHDDLVMAIDNYGIVGNHDGFTEYLGFMTDECLAECVRRENCVITTVYPDDHREADKGKHRCRLQNIDNNIINFSVCDRCKTFIQPTDLTSPIRLRKLRYSSSVRRNNKVKVRGSTYDELLQFCSFVCSIDHSCTGFELSTRSYYKYNCATYSEHTTNFVNVDDLVFETYIIPDLAKRELQNNLQMNEIDMYGLGIEAAISSMIYEQKCNWSECKSNFNCLVSSSMNSDLCINVMNEQNIGTMSVKEDVRLHLRIFPERAYPEGWVNISLPNSYIRSAPKISGLNNSTRDDLDLDNCAVLCSSDIFCRFVLWESNKKCVKFTSASVTTYGKIQIFAPFHKTEETNAANTILMIPSQRAKMLQRSLTADKPF